MPCRHGEAGPRQYEAGVAGRDLDRQPHADERAGARLEIDVLDAAQVEAGVAVVRGLRQLGVSVQPQDGQVDHASGRPAVASSAGPDAGRPMGGSWRNGA
jgi:hypothetical protein